MSGRSKVILPSDFAVGSLDLRGAYELHVVIRAGRLESLL